MSDSTSSATPSPDFVVDETGTGLRFTFPDNAAFLRKGDAEVAVAAIRAQVEAVKGSNLVLAGKPTDYAVSAAEAQRLSTERLLMFRSLLIDAGVSPSLIRLTTFAGSTALTSDGQGHAGLDYGWVEIQPAA